MFSSQKRFIDVAIEVLDSNRQSRLMKKDILSGPEGGLRVDCDESVQLVVIGTVRSGMRGFDDAVHILRRSSEKPNN